MSKNKIDKCKSCKGTGLNSNQQQCNSCKGTGVNLYDEEYDSALPFMGENLDDDIIDDE